MMGCHQCLDQLRKLITPQLKAVQEGNMAARAVWIRSFREKVRKNQKILFGRCELSGIGGNESKVGGRGPMLVKSIDTNGNAVYIVDPAGVFLLSSRTQRA